MADLDVGNFPLGLHLAKPAQGRSALFVEKGFEEPVGVNEFRLGGQRCFHLRNLLEFGEVVGVNQEPEAGPALLGQAHDRRFVFLVGEPLRVIPETHGGEAFALLAFDEEIGMQRVGSRALRIAAGQSIALGLEENSDSTLESLPCLIHWQAPLSGRNPWCVATWRRPS